MQWNKQHTSTHRDNHIGFVKFRIFSVDTNTFQIHLPSVDSVDSEVFHSIDCFSSNPEDNHFGVVFPEFVNGICFAIGLPRSCVEFGDTQMQEPKTTPESTHDPENKGVLWGKTLEDIKTAGIDLMGENLDMKYLFGDLEGSALLEQIFKIWGDGESDVPWFYDSHADPDNAMQQPAKKLRSCHLHSLHESTCLWGMPYVTY